MLVERRIAVFRAELDLLVGGEHARIAIDRVAIAPARNQVRAVRHAVHRIVLAQRAVIAKRIVDEIRRQPLEIEIARGRACRVGREVDRAFGGGEAHADSEEKSPPLVKAMLRKPTKREFK